MQLPIDLGDTYTYLSRMAVQIFKVFRPEDRLFPTRWRFRVGISCAGRSLIDQRVEMILTHQQGGAATHCVSYAG